MDGAEVVILSNLPEVLLSRRYVLRKREVDDL